MRAQIGAVLGAWGLAPDLLETTVEAMVYADLAGIDSHGLSMLMMYEGGWRAGKLDLRARPRVVREGPATALVDAGAGLGHPAGVAGMRLAMEKALAVGVGAVAVRNSHHFGALGYYAALAPPRGLLGLVTSSTRDVTVVPTRGTAPVLGTNPLAFAAPAGRNRPFLLDMSTSTAAANKVKVHELNGWPVPGGWVVDERGRPVTDPGQAMDLVWRRRSAGGGGLTPLGGTAEMASHKGYGLGVMVQLLSSTLSGASFSPVRNRTRPAGSPDDIGHFFLALDPRAFREEGAFEADADLVLDALRATPPAEPSLPVLVAGDPEEAARAARTAGTLAVPAPLAEQIRAICGRCGAPYLL
ncbi:MAG: Ldh family oxidoreductase [Deltaproteobacteria bacterium]|nr:Ldh family oxidoreductase [Deltaproteobacteria bacterium]